MKKEFNTANHKLPALRPLALEPGDTVAIVAPASNLKAEYLARGVAELERLGLRASYRHDILARDRYTAGDDRRRVAELIEALTQPSIKAVWAARGGYGSMRLLPLLDRELPDIPPRIFVGYSDMTALHLYLYRRFGWVTFHGPMVAKDLAGGEDHYDRRTMLGLLTSPSPHGEIETQRLTVLHRGSLDKVSGRLVGGCLSLIAAMIGTPSQLETDQTILFLEDTGTRPYAIDRLLQQLKQSGMLRGVRALIFGEMYDCQQHPEQGYLIEDVLTESTADLGIPVLFGLRSGHSPLHNLTLPLGVSVTVDLDSGRLIIDEAAVSPAPPAIES